MNNVFWLFKPCVPTYSEAEGCPQEVGTIHQPPNEGLHFTWYFLIIRQVDLFMTSGSIPKDYSIEDSYLYVTSKKSETFHKITCEHVVTIKEENLIYFHSLEEALSSGRRGCKQCKPEE